MGTAAWLTGGGGSGSTVSVSGRVLDAALPLDDSVLVAVTVIDTVPTKPAGGSRLMWAASQPVTSALVWPALAKKLCRPSLRVAPTGTPCTASVTVSDPSVSVRAAASVGRFTAWSCMPVWGCRPNTMLSSTPPSELLSVARNSSLPAPVWVATRLSVKWVSAVAPVSSKATGWPSHNT